MNSLSIVPEPISRRQVLLYLRHQKLSDPGLPGSLGYTLQVSLSRSGLPIVHRLGARKSRASVPSACYTDDVPVPGSHPQTSTGNELIRPACMAVFLFVLGTFFDFSVSNDLITFPSGFLQRPTL